MKTSKQLINKSYEKRKKCACTYEILLKCGYKPKEIDGHHGSCPKFKGVKRSLVRI